MSDPLLGWPSWPGWQLSPKVSLVSRWALLAKVSVTDHKKLAPCFPIRAGLKLKDYPILKYLRIQLRDLWYIREIKWPFMVGVRQQCQCRCHFRFVGYVNSSQLSWKLEAIEVGFSFSQLKHDIHVFPGISMNTKIGQPSFRKSGCWEINLSGTPGGLLWDIRFKIFLSLYQKVIMSVMTFINLNI